MADNAISKIKLGSAVYRLKDEETQAAVAALQTAVASSLTFKGVISSATEITELVNYKVGWTYRANSNIFIPIVGTLEPGDMIICISDYSSNYKASDWTVVQNNVDVMTGAKTNTAGTKGLVPAPAAKENGKFLKGNGSWSYITIDDIYPNGEVIVLKSNIEHFD